MDIDDAIRTGYTSLLARPAAILPFYVAGLATTSIARVVLLAGMVVAYASVAGTGRLAALERALADDGPINIDDPATFSRFDQPAAGPPTVEQTALVRALDQVFTTELVWLVGGTLVLTVLLVFVVGAVFSAGQIHAVYAVLTGSPATRSGVAGIGRHGTTFAGLVLAEAVIYALVFAGLVGFARVAGPAVLLVGLAVLVGMVVVRLAFAFARPAAVVDDLGVQAAMRAGYHHVSAHTVGSLVYGAVTVGLIVGASMAGSFVGGPGTSTASSLVIAVVLAPILDATKLELYGGPRGESLAVPTSPVADYSTRLRRAVRTGLGAVGGFVRGHPVHLVVSALVFAGGILLGIRMGAAIDHLFVASIEQRLGRVGPLGMLVGYAANNSSVGAAIAFSGVALGIPTLVSLAFNGANIGLLYQLDTDPEVLIAFVIPHGLIELPALVIAGALGLHLGVLSWRVGVGTVDRETIAEEVDRAFRVVVGLAVLFAVAAVIEAFVSPYYWRLLGV